LVALPDGRALVIGGGEVGKWGTVSTIEAFDPVSETFQVVAKGFPNLDRTSATLAGGGEVLVLGSEQGAVPQAWIIKP
jgi:hypothetical protein